MNYFERFLQYETYHALTGNYIDQTYNQKYFKRPVLEVQGMEREEFDRIIGKYAATDKMHKKIQKMMDEKQIKLVVVDRENGTLKRRETVIPCIPKDLVREFCSYEQNNYMDIFKTGRILKFAHLDKKYSLFTGYTGAFNIHLTDDSQTQVQCWGFKFKKKWIWAIEDQNDGYRSCLGNLIVSSEVPKYLQDNPHLISLMPCGIKVQFNVLKNENMDLVNIIEMETGKKTAIGHFGTNINDSYYPSIMCEMNIPLLQEPAILAEKRELGIASLTPKKKAKVKTL